MADSIYSALGKGEVNLTIECEADSFLLLHDIKRTYSLQGSKFKIIQVLDQGEDGVGDNQDRMCPDFMCRDSLT